MYGGQPFHDMARPRLDGTAYDVLGIGPDADIISCPKCYVPLIKSEGCNAVVCPCGQSFDYARRKRELELAQAFGIHVVQRLLRLLQQPAQCIHDA